ncbi:MAG: NAD-dependent epimerase/dehydratase family protein [Minisyncoccia bacterium]|jgi:nucleoside-diphosphate-sugar epimerase
MKKIGITGASGFVGKHFVKKFIDDGYFVNAYVRNAAKIDFLAKRYGEKLRIFEGDINDEKNLENFVKESDIIVHLAAGTGGTYDDYYNTTVKGSELIFKLCEKNKKERLVYMSSVSIYDLNQAANSVVTEDTPFEPHMDLRGWYAKTKALGEQSIASKIDSSELPVTILRAGLVYAPNMKMPLMGCGIIRGSVGINLGMGDKRLPYIHIDDLHGAVKAAIKGSGKESGTYNVVSDEQPTTREIVEYFNEFAPDGKRMLFVPKSFFVLNPILGRYGYLLARAQKDIYYSAENLKSELGWKAVVPFREAMKQMVDFHYGPVRIGIIGCGFAMRTLHLPVIIGNLRIKVEAIYDIDEKSAKQIRDDFFPKAEAVRAISEFKNRKLDFVAVSTPPATHLDIARELSGAGINLMIEKPLALNLLESREIAKMADGSNAKICVINNYRFRRNILAMKSAMRKDGAKINLVRVRFWSGPVIKSAGGWREKMKNALLYDMAYHFIDLGVELAGDFKKAERLKTEHDSSGILVNLEGTVATKNGNDIILDLKMFPPHSETFIEARSENKTYFAGFYPESFRIKSGAPSPLSDLRNSVKTMVQYVIDKKIRKDGNFSHRQIYNGFISSLKDETERVPVTAEDVLPTMELLENIAKQC